VCLPPTSPSASAASSCQAGCKTYWAGHHGGAESCSLTGSHTGSHTMALQPRTSRQSNKSAKEGSSPTPKSAFDTAGRLTHNHATSVMSAPEQFEAQAQLQAKCGQLGVALRATLCGTPNLSTPHAYSVSRLWLLA